MNTCTQAPKATGTDLVKSVSIENLVNQRAAAVEQLEHALLVLNDAAQNAKAANIGFPDIGICIDNSRNWRNITGIYPAAVEDLIKQATKAIDAGAWKYLMEQSGNLTFLDAQARNEWGQKIHAYDVPELNKDNILATFTNMHDNRQEMFERGVIALFKALSWDYKTNQPFKFTERIIFRYMFTVHGTSGQKWISADHRSADKLDDLERVMHILDQKPEPDHRAGWYKRLCTKEPSKSAQSDYLGVKWFLNGNGHILFKRLDLVEKMNLILAKHYPNAIASEVR